VQLSEYRSKFEALGIRVAAITYDPNETSRKFSEKHGIEFPIFRDVNAKYVRQFGILNEKYEPGDWAWGIPHPGMFLVDGDGVIRGKFAEEDYRKRPAFDIVLEAAKEMVRKQQTVEDPEEQ